MIADHTIKFGGHWYNAGEEIPSSAPTISAPLKEEKKAENKYTKTQIMRLSTADLHKLAKAESLVVSDDVSGQELKKMLIQHFEL